MKKRNIAVLTGIRSEYDIFFPVLKSIQVHPELELTILASGAHLAPQFGHTIEQIENDGFPIGARIESLLDSNTAASRLKSAAIQQLGLVQELERIGPDILLVCGDREEAINAALAGAYMNIPVAHLAGGDIVVGNVDDSIRHAVTKLAHLHFPFSKESANRIARMGEEAWRITVSGNPGLDRFEWLPKLSRQQLAKRLDIPLDDNAPLLLIIQHNISSEIHEAAQQMQITLQAVAGLGFQALVGYPNSDAGSRDIIEVIQQFAKKTSIIHPYQNLPREVFASVLREADVLVGNSSLGIFEAPFLKLPVVNIGNRQKKREHAENIRFVPHDRQQIKDEIQFVLNNESFQKTLKKCTCPFGDGHAAEIIVRTLAETSIDSRLLVKDWTY